MPISPLPEHKIAIFVRFLASEPSFSGISSTIMGFLCAFGVWNLCFWAFRAQNRGFCAHLLNWMLGWGTFPPTEASSHLRSRRTCAAYTTADATVAAPAQPLHLRSRRICVAAVPSAVACSRLSPVPPVLPLLPPLHLLNRFTCGAAAYAQPILPQPTPVAPAGAGACGLGYHSGLGGGVEDVVD